MNELYQSSIERMDNLSSKKVESVVESASTVVEEVKIKKTSIISYFLGLVFNTFIGIPSPKLSSSFHFFMGLIKSCTYIYIMFEITSVKEYVASFGYSSTFTTIFMGLFAIFSLVQFIVGLFTASQSFFITGMTMSSSGNGDYYYGEKDYLARTPSDNKTEMSTTMDYMNAKMTGMSNRKKEKYLSDFYGGKL